MRLVQVTIPAGKRETVLGALDDEGIDYVVTDETSGRKYTAVVYFPLPTNAVEPVLDTLQEIGIEEQSYTVVVNAETVISRRFSELEEEYASNDIGEDRISRQELRTKADELTPTFPIYVTMTLISAIVATAGLLLDSPAVVVGSMVIAPLIGPALGASVGTVIDDHEMFLDGLKYQALGVAIAIVGSAIFAWVMKTASIVPPGLDIQSVSEINERLAPNLLALAIALGAGVAGIISLSPGASVALVGVMIAAALIPPAGAAGIALAWGEPFPALGATVLVLVNVLSVNLAGLLTLWYTGYRPDAWFQIDEAKRATVKNVGGFALAVLVLSAFLAGVTYTGYQNSTFETTVDETVATTGGEYDELVVLETQVRTSNAPFEQPERVVVTVGHSPGTDPPEIAAELRERIESQTDRSVPVEVRYTEVDTAD
ncbi:MAG: TIGR00341 family protein [Halalkalicoccus sp.]